MSGSIPSGAAYARSASLSISSSNGPQGPQTDRGATSIGSGSKLGNVEKSTASVRTATVTQAKPEHEAYGWRDALKDVGSVFSGVAKHPATRLFLGLGLMAAGVALALTGVGMAVIGLGMGAAMVGLGTAGTGVFGLITLHTAPADNQNAQAREAQQKAAAWNQPSDPLTADLTAPMKTPDADADTRAYHESRYADDPNEFVVPTPTQGVDAWDEPVPGNDHLDDRQDPYATALQHAIS